MSTKRFIRFMSVALMAFPLFTSCLEIKDLTVSENSGEGE